MAADRRTALLACLENAVRLAIEAGASADDVRESVRWALATPEQSEASDHV